VVLAVGRSLDLAGFEIHFPRVERTDDRTAGDDAVAERSAFVRALVVGGEKLVPCPERSRGTEMEKRDLALANQHSSSLTRWDVPD
jgi:hypothetical protein